MELAQALATILFFQALISFSGLPVLRKWYDKSPLLAVIISSLLGWLVVSYAPFALSILGLVSHQGQSLASGAVIWSVINIVVAVRSGWLAQWVRASKSLVVPMLTFAFSLLVFTWFRSFYPDISIKGEHFMNIGFINAIDNNRFLRFEDIWFIGKEVNYYYFTQFIAYLWLKLLNLSAMNGFFLLVCWLFALTSNAIFYTAISFYNLLVNQKELKNTLGSVLVGVFSIIATLLGGNFQSLTWFARLQDIFQGVYSLEPLIEFARMATGKYLETPSYAFQFTDLHPHVWGILSQVILMAVIGALLTRKNAEEKISIAEWVVVAVTTAMVGLMNAWDVLPAGLLILALLYVEFKNVIRTRWKELLAALCVLGITVFSLVMPWYITFHNPTAGIARFEHPWQLGSIFLFWGQFIVYGIVAVIMKRFVKKTAQVSSPLLSWINLIIVIGILLVLAVEFVYLKDFTDTSKNTAFKIYLTVWIWMGVLLPVVIGYYYRFISDYVVKFLLSLVVVAALGIQILYPYASLFNVALFEKSTSILDTDNWFAWKYPDDLKAIRYLESKKSSLPVGYRSKHIVEAVAPYDEIGRSYFPGHFYSGLLGWNSLMGSYPQEQSWGRSKSDIALRTDEVKTIYTSHDSAQVKTVLDKYNIDYVVYGAVEREAYKNNLYPYVLKELCNAEFTEKLTTIYLCKK